MISINKTQGGFSILEVLITAAIIGLITGLVTLKYGAFNHLLLLKNQTFQAAIDLRETQARALSALGQGGTNFRDAYGVHFTTGANDDRYIIFIDTNNNGSYDAGEEIETRRLDSRFRVNRLCSTTSSCNWSQLSITFKRPNFDARFKSGNTTLSSGRVEFRSRSGATTVRTVVINAAGQISVE